MANKETTIYECDHCGLRMKSKGGLTQHVNKKHRKGKMQENARNTDIPAPAQIEPTALVSDLTGLGKNAGGYVTLILYIALPRVYRKGAVQVDTQEDLAKLLKVDEATLTRWKARPGFWDDVRNVQIKYFTERIGDVILAQENEAIKGHTPAARLVLEAVGYLKKDDKENQVPQLLAEAIKNISTILDK